MRTLSVDIEGLDLVLGGGVPVFKRHESFAGESATIVVRGPPGSGKTVFGSQLATSLARTLGEDVAYACVELLPSELAAQHGGAKRPGLAERVVEPPFPHEERTGTECRVYAGLLDLGTPSAEQARLMPAIDELLGAVRQAGGKPGVVVVDSISNGYHLGRSAPRPLADELCKMAVEQGMILVLLEETTDAEPSAWCFAADMVIELDIGGLAIPEAGDALHLRVRVTKNRFGPCEPGPHRAEIGPASGVRVYPNQVAHTRPWAVSTLLPGWKPEAWAWGLRLDNLKAEAALGGPQSFLPFNRCVTIVFGPSAGDVALVAAAIGRLPTHPLDVLLSFGIEPGLSYGEAHRVESLRVVPLGTLFTSDQIVAQALGSLSRIWQDQRTIGRVFLGDLHRLSGAWGPERTRQTLGTLIYFLRRARLPAILVETSQSSRVSPFLAFADVAIRVVGVVKPNVPQVTLIRLGLIAETTDPLPESAVHRALMSDL